MSVCVYGVVDVCVCLCVSVSEFLTGWRDLEGLIFVTNFSEHM